ncbi:hypothetical protein AB4072_00515 [Microvirga sp. 2MCAF38]|uniref:hypothetical protein n=1 Tax=Microvirga sp. 2MCAF38 TaxID=3232989 RepID=UPI003F95B191
MSQATESPTPSLAQQPDALVDDEFVLDPPVEDGGIRSLIFGMEEAIAESLCLSDALITLMEGRRGTLRVKPSTVYFLAGEVQRRLTHLNEEWQRLFTLTRSLA